MFAVLKKLLSDVMNQFWNIHAIGNFEFTGKLRIATTDIKSYPIQAMGGGNNSCMYCIFLGNKVNDIKYNWKIAKSWRLIDGMAR